MKDKEKQIEEMARVLCQNQCSSCTGATCLALLNCKALYEQGYRKIDKDSVAIPKEISCYENIEKGVRTFRLDGNKIDFTHEQILALTQIFHFKEKQEKEIRKETASEIIDMLIPDCKSCDAEQHKGCMCLRAKLAGKIAKRFGVQIKE